MNISTGKTHWSPEELETLRTSLREAMVADGITQAEVSRRSQVPASTLSQFLSNSYKGDVQSVARDLARWIDARHREAEFRSVAPPEPTFVRTPTADKVFRALQHAQLLSDMVVIVGPPGVGKTAAAQAYSRATPRVLAVTASPALASAAAILSEIIRRHATVSRDRMNRSLAERSAQVRDLLEQGALLQIDEAQHVSMAALEELRAIHDDKRCGLALMGNSTVLSRIEGAQRDPAYAQLYSRAGWRLSLEKGGERDVSMVMETMGLTDPEIIRVACQIATKESLRVVVKAARSAVLLASANNDNLGPQHLQAAYRQLGGK